MTRLDPEAPAPVPGNAITNVTVTNGTQPFWVGDAPVPVAGATDAPEGVELWPCPFCGEDAVFERKGDRRASTIVACTICGCRHECGEEWGHGRAWNTRAPTEAAIRAAALEEAGHMILHAAADECILMHAMETDAERMGRKSAVRGMMVRLGLYDKLEDAIAAAIRARIEKEPTPCPPPAPAQPRSSAPSRSGKRRGAGRGG